MRLWPTPAQAHKRMVDAHRLKSNRTLQIGVEIFGRPGPPSGPSIGTIRDEQAIAIGGSNSVFSKRFHIKFG